MGHRCEKWAIDERWPAHKERIAVNSSNKGGLGVSEQEGGDSALFDLLALLFAVGLVALWLYA